MARLTYADRYYFQTRRTATHIYLRPHPALWPYVAHYTLCLASPQPAAPETGTLTLIPDASGCLVFTLLPQGLEGRMYGPTTETVTVQNDLGVCPLRFFVEFRPGGLYAFTGIPQWELADRVWPLADTHPDLDRAVTRLFAQSDDLDDFVLAVDRLLLSRLPTPAPVLPMLRLLARDATPAPVQSLADYTGYSPRQLSRLFREGAGMGAKAFAQVLRVNAAVRRLQAGESSLTRLAQELGYYDQAHFIHDFKRVAGVTPGVYRAGLPGFYNEPLKF